MNLQEPVLPANSRVRIERLIAVDRPYVGAQPIQRPPSVGDTGVIVHVVQHRWHSRLTYIVKNTSADGRTVWLADFRGDELVLLGG